MSGCSCNIGPGRFEGEPASTFILDHLTMDGEGEQIMYAEDAGCVVFDGQFTVADYSADADLAAVDYGYCQPCVDAAWCELRDMVGAVVSWDAQGFVYGRVYGPGMEDRFARVVAEARKLADEYVGADA